MTAAFDGVRVVDLSDRLSGAYAARIFGDYGADVVLAEPPEGHALRHEPPFLDNVAGVERSLLHAYINWNKRAVIVEENEALCALVASADILITTAIPSTTRLIEIALAALPGDAIHLSITPHGLSGSLAGVSGNNLTACARTGWCHMNGCVDGPPLQLPVWQTGYIAGVTGFIIASAALYRRLRTGEGERIDVAEDEPLAHTAAPWATLALFVGTERISRGPMGLRERGSTLPLWKTLDGLINFGYGDWPRWREAMELLGQPELANDERYVPRFGRNQQDHRPVRKGLEEATSTRKKWDIFHGLANLHCISGVVQNTRELLGNEQLNTRKFFVRTHLLGRDLRASGPPAKLSGTPWQLAKPAPTLGGLIDKSAQGDPAEGRTPMHKRPLTSKRRGLPLDGIRVLTFTQAWSGPFGTELLAFLGADVVQIEGRQRPDVWRGAGAPVGPTIRDPEREQNPLNTNGMYNTANLNKRAITLDMTQSRGKEMFWEMVPKFDIIADNFSPHVLPNWGVTLETLREKRPDIILASISGYGTDGPLTEYPANGATTEPMAGLASIHGYEGDEAMNTGGLIPDPISGFHFAAAIMAALHHRERTGEGQRIDVAMIEAVTVQLGDAILECDGNDTIRRPSGNRHPRIAPHGIFATGDGRWLAIAAESEKAWIGLLEQMGKRKLVEDPRFSTNSARKQNENALDEIISEWCMTQQAEVAEHALGEAGVCAATVRSLCDVYSDPSEHFREREFLIAMAHPESGTHFMPVAPWKLDGTDHVPARCAPCFGEHSREVFAEELGISDEEFKSLEDSGITGTTRIG